MKVTTDIQNIYGRYNAQVATSDFSKKEEDLMAQFGEPLIETGGLFDGTVTMPDNTVVTLSFELPSHTRRMRSDFPAKAVFDLEDYGDADVRAKLWANSIAARLAEQKTFLYSLESNFTGTTITTV